MSAEVFDAIVIGAGPAGEVSAGDLAAGGLKVAVVEAELVAGECSYWACMPSKTLLRPTELIAAARRVPGAREAVTGHVDVAQTLLWRDRMVSDWDDAGQSKWLTARGIEIVRGAAKFSAPGRLSVGDRELESENIVICTGSVPVIPPIPGLDSIEYWTNRQATSVTQIPDRFLVMGGGAVGVELAQAYARLGSSVAIIERSDRLLEAEDPRVSDAVAELLREDNVEVHLNSKVVEVGGGEKETWVKLDDGVTLRGSQLLVATGRRANIDGLGLENSGVTTSKQGIVVDEYLRAAPGVWAAGDVNGISMFTHVGKYQARIIAADILGKPREAHYAAIPHVAFTDPQMASVGLTPAAAREQGIHVITGSGDLRSTARTSIQRTDWRDAGDEFLTLVADAERGVIIGAFAVGDQAGEWIGQATLAVRSETSIETLADTIQPFLTLSEAFTIAVLDLQKQAT